MSTSVSAPMTAVVSQLKVSKGDFVNSGDPLVVLEAMKMEYVITAPHDGKVEAVMVGQGQVVQTDASMIRLAKSTPPSDRQETEMASENPEEETALTELIQRKRATLDKSRPAAVSKRHAKGKRTARENIADLCDPDSFHEYGSLIIAAQRKRRSVEELIEQTPADGIVTGIGRVNGDLFGESTSRCMVLAYDYTVLAGTQGAFGHKKTDRMFRLAAESGLPLVLFAEGGGGRPGDTDFPGVGGLDVMTFSLFAELNGKAPRIAIVSGYCFAGNAALAGCADVIIATEDSSLGMGGPAMIEGGGLGVFHPREVGPSAIQSANGVIDILVKDEQEAVKIAKQYLSYFQGRFNSPESASQDRLREIVPQNRRQVYDIREVITTLADQGSFLELRKGFAAGMITGLIRIGGIPMGLVANNPAFMAGAINSEGADKAARFLQLCNTFGLPVLSLCDTPGIMVGPEAEKTGTVRHASRLFTIGANLRIPLFAVVLRRAYGLGSMAMAGGSFHKPFFTLSWPTGEFGGMGLEGAIRLGFKKELAQVEDPEAREALFEKMLAEAYAHGKAISTASYFEIDEVIDPAHTRKWILQGLSANPRESYMNIQPGFYVDTW